MKIFVNRYAILLWRNDTDNVNDGYVSETDNAPSIRIYLHHHMEKI